MADDNNKQSSTKETIQKDDGSLSSDSEGSQLERCDTCGIALSDAKTRENHMKGKKHQKAVARAKFMAKHGELPKTSEEESDSEDDDENSNELYCKVCDKYITGHISYMTHLKGSKHAKNVKKEKLKERMKNLPEVLGKEDKENVSDDEVLQKPFARCDLCQKEFSGPESLNLHMKSSSHKKKLQQSKIADNLKAKYQADSKSDNEEDVFGNCSVCQKAFSGPVPYQIHMESKLHKKNLEKMKMAEELKEFCSKNENGTAYICKECKKTFNDPAAFKNHMKKNSHEKQKAKTALNGFLSSHPEIAFTTPFGDQNPENDGEATDQEYFIICKICHVAFSGAESAQDHVKSKKHLSLLKNRKMQKLLKDQEKDANDSSKLNGEEMKRPQNAKETEKSNVTNGDSVSGMTHDSENHPGVDDFELL